MNLLRFSAASLGDRALTLTFAEHIEPAITQHIRALAPAVANIEGVVETVPCYAALTVHFDPMTLAYDALMAELNTLNASIAAADVAPRQWRVPACYHPDIAEDIAEAATALGVSVDALAEAHTAATFEIAMYGFAPGWAYLSGTPAALNLPRRLTPRGPTPADALLIAGGQAMLAANPMPTGWYVIGRSAQPSFFLDRTPPVVFDVGDRLSFYAVEPSQWQSMYAAAKAGERVAERVR